MSVQISLIQKEYLGVQVQPLVNSKMIHKTTQIINKSTDYTPGRGKIVPRNYTPGRGKIVPRK